MTGSVQSGLRTGVFRPEKEMNFYENHSMPGSSALRLAKQPKLLGGIICPLSLVDIGLTDLPKSGGGMPLPAHYSSNIISFRRVRDYFNFELVANSQYKLETNSKCKCKILESNDCYKFLDLLKE